MNIVEMVYYAFNSLRYRSVRSWLTVLGIVVGITTIVVLIGLVQGLKDDITSQIKGFGARTIVIMPASSTGTPGPPTMSATKGKLFMKDYERVKKVPEIEYITPGITGRTTVKYKDKEITAAVTGVEPEIFKQTATLQIEKGRFLTASDQKAMVIGYNVATDRFKEIVQLSSNLAIAGETYRVVGILNKTGSSFGSSDDAMYIPLDEAKKLFNDSLAENEISTIRVTVKDGTDVEVVADEINSIMLASHRVKEEEKDFTLITPAYINRSLDSVTGTLSLFMGAIAGIALAVGGIGIMNTMFMTVLERRREIGVLKAIGATESEIEQMFLVESSMIGFFGGFIGLVLAFVLVWLIDSFSGVPAVFIPWVAAGALFFSATIGILAGVLPARQAAKLDPVETLRYE